MSTAKLAENRTSRQRLIRKHLSERTFEEAVVFAANNLFSFTHRAAQGRALWSDVQTVWLGKNTFLDWCLEDREFDIPWLVTGTTAAPRDREDMHHAVKQVLTDYYAKCLSNLPRRSTGSWLPLP